MEGPGHRPRHQPARRELDPDRLRPRLRAVLRLLDDELRRGPARAVGARTSRPRGARRSSAPTRRSSSRRSTIIPGLVALVTVKGLGGSDPDLQYNNAIPLLIARASCPNGMLGIAITGLLAAFMAGVAANVTLVQHGLHLRPLAVLRRARAATPHYYVRVGRLATVGGLAISIGHGVHRQGLLEHHGLRPAAVLLLQRAAVRDVHHRDVLAADDGVGGVLGPVRRASSARPSTHILLQRGRSTSAPRRRRTSGTRSSRSWSTRSSPSASRSSRRPSPTSSCAASSGAWPRRRRPTTRQGRRRAGIASRGFSGPGRSSSSSILNIIFI